jgi:argininosuccinate lyase
MAGKLWDKGASASSEDDRVEAFTVGNDHLIDAHILSDDCLASIAHAAALARTGVLSASEFDALQRELLVIIEAHDREGVPIDRSQEDCHTAIEQLLTERLGDIGKKIHTGRSRNDQVLTALRLFTRRRLLDVTAGLQTTATRLLGLAEGGVRVPMRGYSHTRPAMPTTLAVWLGGFVESLLCDAIALRAAYDLNDRSPLGSAAGFGSTVPLDREFTRDLLGFTHLQVNALFCQTSRGKVEGAVLHALESIQGTLAALASDLILYSTAEYGFLSLPDGLTTGSSIMPQKRNPDVLELVRARAGVVAGAAARVRAVSSGLTSGYHRDYQLLKEPLIEALSSVEDSLAMMDRVLASLVFDEAAMAASCTREIYAADVALEKAQADMPFRDAYRAAMSELGDLTIDAEFIASRIDAYVTLGSMGNPGLDRYVEPLVELASWAGERRERHTKAIKRLRGPLA